MSDDKITNQNDEAEKLEEVDEKKELRVKLDQCAKEKEEYLNGWKRAKADLINYQKDEVKRLEEVAKFGNWDLVRDLITVLDSFDLAVAILGKDERVEKGVYMIRAQLEDALKKRGLERIMVSVGQPFDPTLHEAVGESIGSGQSSSLPAGEAGTVAEEIERGYLLNGRVIRPARIKINK